MRFMRIQRSPRQQSAKPSKTWNMRIYENLLNLLELFQVETTTNMTNEKNKIENTFFSPEFHG
jgi:hypothetical protein